MSKLYIATIQVAIVADDHSEACDAVSESLRNVQVESGEAGIIDWQYLPFGGIHLGPTLKIDLRDGQHFFEGEAFRA